MAGEAAIADRPAIGLSEDRALLPFVLGLLVSMLAIVFLPEAVAADLAVRIFVTFLILTAVLDLFTRRVPNILVYPATAFSLAATAVIDPSLLVQALLGGWVVLAIMIVLAIIQRGAMGMGDVKVACFGGCILGLKGGVFALIFGFIAAGAVALPIVLLKLRDRRDYMPLAPFLAIGILAAFWFWGFLIDGDLGILHRPESIAVQFAPDVPQPSTN
jgi:leader peptidase (prepilin peptidase)/N-methyltransferase